MKKTNLLIIGSGPGGYRTASYAAQNGLEVTIIEKAQPGGTCLNAGCIPTKCLAHDAELRLTISSRYETTPPLDFTKVMERKEGVINQLREGVSTLLSQPGIDFIVGEARFVSDHVIEVNGEQIEAEHIIIATGSRSKMPPFMSEEDFLNQSKTARGPMITEICGITPDAFVFSELLSIAKVPNRLTIIGAGIIGMEFASAFSAFGSEVTVIEFMKECLPPIDSDIAKRLRKTLEKRGVTFYMQSAVKQILSPAESGQEYTTVVFDKKGKEDRIDTDLVLIATGRQANFDNIGIETTGIEVNAKGIVVNDNMETNVKGVYAIGDVNARQMLAHAATFQGFRAVNHILGKDDNIRLDIMPSAIFTYPEAACVGKTEDQCKAEEIKYSTRKGFYRANGKALSMEETEGMIKLLIAEDGSILGAHCYGAHSADLIQEVAALMNYDAKLDKIRDIIHIHPTLSEILQDALL